MEEEIYKFFSKFDGRGNIVNLMEEAIYIGEMGRSVKTRKRKHVSAVRNFDPEKSALCQHVLEHDHVIDWENVEILKSEPHANRRRTAESF